MFPHPAPVGLPEQGFGETQVKRGGGGGGNGFIQSRSAQLPRWEVGARGAGTRREQCYQQGLKLWASIS